MTKPAKYRRFNGRRYHLHPTCFRKKTTAAAFATRYRKTRPDFHARVVKIGKAWRVYCNPAGCTSTGWPAAKTAAARNSARRAHYHYMSVENKARKAASRADKAKPSVKRSRKLRAVGLKASRAKTKKTGLAPF